MKQFTYTDSDKIYIDESSSSVRALSLTKITELASLLDLDVVQFTGDGTITIQSTTCNKSSIPAIKYKDDFLFFIYWCTAGIIIASLDSNFDLIGTNILFNNSALTAATRIDYIKTSNAIMFTSANAQDGKSCYVAISTVRDANGVVSPATASRYANSSSIRVTHANGTEDVSHSVSVSLTYNTLVAIQKIACPTLQLIFDHVWVATSTGVDPSPRQVLLNGSKWQYSGQYSTNAYGFYIKLDE